MKTFSELCSKYQYPLIEIKDDLIGSVILNTCGIDHNCPIGYSQYMRNYLTITDDDKIYSVSSEYIEDKL